MMPVSRESSCKAPILSSWQRSRDWMVSAWTISHWRTCTQIFVVTYYSLSNQKSNSTIHWVTQITPLFKKKKTPLWSLSALMLCLFHDSVGLIRPHISVSVSPTFATRNRPATETSLKAHTCIKRTTSLSPCSPQAFNKNTDNASAGVKMTRHGLTWIKSLSTRQRAKRGRR